MSNNKNSSGFGGKRRPMGNGAKAKNFNGTFKRLLGYLKPFKFGLILVLIMTVLSTLFTVYSPKILGDTLNVIIKGMIAKFERIPNASIDFSKLFHYVVILLALYVLSSGFLYLQKYLMSEIAQKTVQNLRTVVDKKIHSLPINYFDTHPQGDVLSRVTNDIDTISSTLQQSLTQIITAIVTIIGITIMMLTISPLLTVICLITLPICFFVAMPIVKKSQRFFFNQQTELGKLSGHVEEMYSGHTVIKSFSKENDAIKDFDKINGRLYESAWKAQFMAGILMPIMRFISNIAYVFIAVVGGVLVVNGRLQVGYIQSFIQYSRQFTQQISQTTNIANILQSTMASAERVFEILDEVDAVLEAQNPVVLENPQGNVAFNNVKFGYSEDKILMSNMNVTAKKGQTVAIVGPTGAGKTTLINLMMRFYELNEGSITFDGVDITKFSREYLRSMFGMVLQDTWLFNGTIKDNIAYGRKGATMDDIVKAAKAAHADHFIRTLPDGYDTILNEEASNISQGQKQLLTIARAILANPKVLILDEATSSVDTRTESYIQNAMTKLMEGRTNFVIAHRLSTIKDADLILVMNNGDVIEQGNHNELMKKGGFYCNLYNSQFANEDESIA